MKKLLITIFVVMAMVCMLAVSVSAAAPLPQKPDIGVNFGTVSTIDGFTAPSELFVNTDERVLLDNGDGNYVTYPTYYVTKNSTTFDFDFSKLNEKLGTEYGKANVVMLEIPDGITTISNSYFAGTGNFPLCVSVQFPGSVTSYGSSLFASYNSVIKVVEFLDGKDPVTMGDGMFGSQHNGGTSSLEYVKFPNNLVSIGNNTFGKSWQNKTIILGANLKSIGTGFFSEATPDDKDTFLYAPAGFFENATMFSNFFGGYDQYHSNLLKITIFFTGSEEDAKAFVAKGLEVQSGYVWSNAKYVSAKDFAYDTDRATARNSVAIVYDYNACDAFYNGVHDIKVEGENKCCGVCANCGLTEMLENPTHTYEWIFNGGKDISYTVAFKAESKCKFCATANPDEEIVEIGAILYSNGISIDETDYTGVYEQIKVDKTALEAYSTLSGKQFDYGIFALVAGEAQTSAPITKGENGKGVAVDQNTVFASFTGTEYTYLRIKITGIPNGGSIFCGAYLVIGDDIVYVSNKQEGEEVNKYTMVTEQA